MSESKSDVWVVFPTANPKRAADALARWSARGYRSAVLVNHGYGTCGHPDEALLQVQDLEMRPIIDLTIFQVPHLGYYASQNHLAKAVLQYGARAVVCAGDDMDPDLTHSPAEILAECEAKYPRGIWVMQPCGDPAGKDAAGVPAAARICGSPWLSPKYIDGGYQRRGPYPTDYGHYYGDEELWNVAKEQSILWLRPDLAQLHQHWSFRGEKPLDYQSETTRRFWDKDKETFRQRRAAGWPGSTWLWR